MLCCRRQQSTRAAGAPAAEEYTPEERSTLVANRIARLKQADSLRYPRVTHKRKRVALEDFWEAYHEKSREELGLLHDYVTVTGRVMHVRRFGSKFFFMHIRDNGRMIQVQVNWGKLEGSECPLPEFKRLSKMITRGDFICTSTHCQAKLPDPV